MTDEPTLVETEAGAILLKGDRVLSSVRTSGESRRERLVRIGEKARELGLQSLKVPDSAAAEEMGKFGVATTLLAESEKEELNSRKLALMVAGGFAADEAEALNLVRESALAAAEERIVETSSREDLQLVHGIQALDEVDRYLNITSERVSEWYGLHFPELQQMLGDNILLARLVAEAGARDQFNQAKLQGKGFSDKKVEAILTAASNSKGGSVGGKDMNRTVGLAHLVLSLSSEREKLAEYVESTMKQIAPNTAEVAGATIGARLIAKAGGLDRLARLPASTVQVLGAEKALFRALRTGARPPKHGILFQHEAVHTAPKWQRGKIARALANKIAIAARIDYYRGEKESALTGSLNKRLDEIRIKYKEPKETTPPKRPFRDDKRPRYRKGRQEGGAYKKPRPGREDVWRKPRKVRRD